MVAMFSLHRLHSKDVYACAKSNRFFFSQIHSFQVELRTYKNLAIELFFGSTKYFFKQIQNNFFSRFGILIGFFNHLVFLNWRVFEGLVILTNDRHIAGTDVNKFS